MRRLSFAAVAIAVLVTTAVLGQPKYSGPWDPAAETAAERAVIRLGTAISQEIKVTILTVPELAVTKSAAP